MRYFIVVMILGSCIDCCPAQTPPPGKLVNLQLESTLVPSPAAVDVLLPPGYEQFSEPVPLLIWLHGGTSGKDYLENRMRPFIERAWATGDLVPCVVVAPVTGASFYIDWHDGTNQWDTFITGQMLAHMRKHYRVKQDRAGTAIGGSSFGGQGTLADRFSPPDNVRRRRIHRTGFSSSAQPGRLRHQLFWRRCPVRSRCTIRQPGGQCLSGAAPIRHVW